MTSTDVPAVVIHLDPWDKLAIIAGAAVFLVIVILLVVCSISPLCCLYHYCPFNEIVKEKSEVPPNFYGSTQVVPISPYQTKKIPEHHPGFWQPLGIIKETDTSDFSDYSSSEIIEMKQDRSKKDLKLISREPTSPTLYTHQEARLGFGLTYDRVEGKLTIRVIKLTNFSATDPDGALTPYVKVRLYRVPKQFFTFRSKSGRDHVVNNLEVEFQTKILRRSDDPVFNEIFIVPIDVNEICNYTLKLLVCDFDKFSRHIVLGEVMVPLSKVEWTMQTEVEYEEQLQPPVDENLGEVQVALMYLPTAEKLSLTVLKAQGLKIMDPQRHSTGAFLKITLMYEGRPLKKAKTSVRHDINPTYNETVTFDVPLYQLDKVYFSVAVLHQEPDGEKETRVLIGRIYLGMNFDKDARAQWNEMINNPRKQVACWHRLQT